MRCHVVSYLCTDVSEKHTESIWYGTPCGLAPIYETIWWTTYNIVIYCRCCDISGSFSGDAKDSLGEWFPTLRMKVIASSPESSGAKKITAVHGKQGVFCRCAIGGWQSKSVRREVFFSDCDTIFRNFGNLSPKKWHHIR
jgi:hypothetical protein